MSHNTFVCGRAAILNDWLKSQPSSPQAKKGPAGIDEPPAARISAAMTGPISPVPITPTAGSLSPLQSSLPSQRFAGRHQLGRCHEVRVFLAHVEQIGLVRRKRTIADTIRRHDGTKVVSDAVDHGGAHAT